MPFLTKKNILAKAVLAGLLMILLPLTLSAAELESVSFDPPSGPAFNLVVDGQTQTVTLAELESLGMYRATTTSPWEAGTFTFEGPLLRDVFTYLGIGDEDQVTIRAVDGFTTVIPQVDWRDGPVMLATRRDGESMNRRAQGPTRIVYPRIDFPAYADEVYKSRWIWLIVSVEVAD